MSREDILRNIQSNKPAPVDLPEMPISESGDTDLFDLFKERVSASGGQCMEINSFSDISDKISETFPLARSIFSNVKGIDLNTLNYHEMTSPHDLKDLDLSIISGGFGVAENGAIWINDANLKYRAACFIAQHLILVIPKHSIVENMMVAYRVLKFSRPGFGCFISGPSKTADIEQSLVIGAHGARSLIVLLVNDQ